MKNLAPHERILVALDVDNADSAVFLVQALAGKVGGFKVGLELVNTAGFDVFSRLADVGADRIFYDAKFHDIPNTVAGAVRAAAKRGVWMVNVHTTGGPAMLKAAREAASAVDTPPLLIGVTVLTSIDPPVLNGALLVPGSVEEYVQHLACLAQSAGLDGIVCSPQEVTGVRSACGTHLLTVVPGVRPTGVAANDQKRFATPGQAVADGADYLVIGRPITAAPDPIAAVEAIVQEIKSIAGTTE